MIQMSENLLTIAKCYVTLYKVNDNKQKGTIKNDDGRT